MKKLQHILTHDKGPGFAGTLPFRFKTAHKHHCNHLTQQGECYGT